jgi:hypothetical protein
MAVFRNPLVHRHDRNNKEHEMSGTCSTHGDTEFCLDKLKIRNHLIDLGADGRLIIKFIVNIQNVNAWTGLK